MNKKEEQFFEDMVEAYVSVFVNVLRFVDRGSAKDQERISLKS